MKSNTSTPIAEKMMNDYQKVAMECYRLVSKIFKGNDNKIDAWFMTPNPNLGNITPEYMLYSGKAEKLLEIIKQLIAENDN